MLYNLDWLNKGKLFPPLTEIKRLKGYQDNANLFDNEPSLVLKPYFDRFQKIIGKLKDGDECTFLDMPNYWQLSTMKTVDLMLGDEPNILCEKVSKELEGILQDTDFHNKLNELVIDSDSLGECLVRPYINAKGERDFVSQSPQLWFPVCNPENNKEIMYDVLCWTVCIHHDANKPANNKYELHCKIQERGSTNIEIRRYACPKHTFYQNYIDATTTENFGAWTFFTIGEMIESKIEQAPYTQLVINIPNMTTSRSLHGMSNYERITSIIAEIAIREYLASFILDQNSSPRLAAPQSAFIKDEKGRFTLKTGGRSFVVAPGEQPPLYITWTGNLTDNEARITELKKEMFSLCEVGPVINQDELNSSQGYEALNVKLTNAKLKVRRMCKSFKTPLKQLLAYLIGEEVTSADINILFNDGIPVSEYQNIITAQAKKTLGVSLYSVLIEYFGLTEEQAKKEVELAKEENSSAFIEAFGINRNADFTKNNPNPAESDVPPPNGPNNPDDDGGEITEQNETR